jgi:hypothetical protein
VSLGQVDQPNNKPSCWVQPFASALVVLDGIYVARAFALPLFMSKSNNPG